MAAILSVLIILSLSILLTRIAAVALAHTGLSREAASFQARSAFTGVGFTTSEAESAVNHPVRRRIIALLMLLGNVGIVTGISSLILGFVNIQPGETGAWARVGILTGGAVVLVLGSRSRMIDRGLSHMIDWALDRWARIEVIDYEALLRVSDAYRVRQIEVARDDWLADRTLGQLALREEGVTLLGVERTDGSFVGVPSGDTLLEPGDVVIAYGRADALRELAERRRDETGDAAHAQAIAGQAAVQREEQRRQAARTRGRHTQP